MLQYYHLKLRFWSRYLQTLFSMKAQDLFHLNATRPYFNKWIYHSSQLGWFRTNIHLRLYQGPSSRRTRVSTIVSGVSLERVELHNLTLWTRLLSTLLQPRVSWVPKWRKARCNGATENVFYHFICLLACTFVKCMIKLREIKWTSIYSDIFQNEFNMHFPPNCPWKDPKNWQQPGTIRCHKLLFRYIE